MNLDSKLFFTWHILNYEISGRPVLFPLHPQEMGLSFCLEHHSQHGVGSANLQVNHLTLMAPIPTSFTHPNHPSLYPNFIWGFLQMGTLKSPCFFQTKSWSSMTLGWFFGGTPRDFGNLHIAKYHTDWLIIGYPIISQVTLSRSPSSSILPLTSNGWVRIVHPLRCFLASFWTPELWS